MKRNTFLYIAALTLVLLLSSMKVTAIKLEYTQGGKTYALVDPPIRLQIHGAIVNTDMPPILVDGRTLVPVRTVCESLGAQVLWDPQKECVDIRLGGIRTQLTVNQLKADVNGKEVVLEVSPQIIHSRMMVPVRFVGQALGLQVGWQDNPKMVLIDKLEVEVEGISYQKEGPNLSVKIQGDVPFSTYTYNEVKMDANPKAYIDISNAVFPKGKEQIPVNHGNMLAIRAAQNQKNPNIVRVVFDMQRITTCTISLSKDRKTMTLCFQNNEAIPTTPKPIRNGKTVVIDPGHGGIDPGAIGPKGTKESDVTLAIALGLRKELEANGFTVVMTREKDYGLGADVYKDLKTRCAIANDASADLFVSCHCNSFINGAAHGSEIFVYQYGGESQKAAKNIQKRFNQEIGLYDRGVKQANFAVLRDTKMPSVLVEAAFISNPKEEGLLRDPGFQEKVYKAIAAGICDYFGFQYVQAGS